MCTFNSYFLGKLFFYEKNVEKVGLEKHSIIHTKKLTFFFERIDYSKPNLGFDSKLNHMKYAEYQVKILNLVYQPIVADD